MQSQPPLKAVLFDLDGTLIASIDHIVECWQHTVRTCLGREITREEVLPTLGRTLYDAFEEIAPGRSQEMYASTGLTRPSHTIPLSPWYPARRRPWRGSEKPGCCLASPPPKAYRQPLAASTCSGLHHSSILSSPSRTPSGISHIPIPLLVASQRLGVPPAEMIYVGDALVDIKAGKAAGMRTAWVTWGSGTIEEIDSLHPDYKFDSMEDLLSLLPTAVQAK